LQRVQLERESGPDFLQIGSASILIELVPMLSEEHKIALVMHRNHPASLQVRDLGEEGGKNAADTISQLGVEVVHDQLWIRIARRCSVPFDFLAQLDPRHPEGGGGAFRQMAEDQAVRFAGLFIPEHQIGVAKFLRFLNHILDLKVLALVIFYVRESRLDLFQKVKKLALGSPVGRHDDLGSRLEVEVGRELVDVLLTLQLQVLIIVTNRLVLYPHRFDGLLLAFGGRFFAVFFSELSFLQSFNFLGHSSIHFFKQRYFLALLFVLD